MQHPPAFDYEGTLKQCAEGNRSALRLLYDQEAPRLLTVVTTDFEEPRFIGRCGT